MPVDKTYTIKIQLKKSSKDARLFENGLKCYIQKLEVLDSKALVVDSKANISGWVEAAKKETSLTKIEEDSSGKNAETISSKT